MEMFECPTCGVSVAKAFAAISRVDNKTRLCGKCGTEEGLSLYREQCTRPQWQEDAENDPLLKLLDDLD